MEIATYDARSSFLDLPQEIQNHIYSYCFDEVNLVVNCVRVQKSYDQQVKTFRVSVSGLNLNTDYVCHKMRKDSHCIRNTRVNVTLRVQVSESLGGYYPRDWRSMIEAIRSSLHKQ